jgi:hypothetical protein
LTPKIRTQLTNQPTKKIMIRTYLLPTFLFLSLLSVNADHHEEKQEKALAESSLIPGTWVRDQVLVEGGIRTWKKEIIADEAPNTFVETITTTDDDGSLNSHWKLKFHVTRANGPTLIFRGYQMNNQDLRNEKWSGWQDANVNYTFQIDEAFWYEFRDLTHKGGLFKYRKVNHEAKGAYQKVATAKLAVLEPMIGVYKGSVQMVNNDSYGIPNGTKAITFTCKWNRDKTLLTGTWAFDDGSFEVPLIVSFNSLQRTVIKNYHTSTGNQITGELIGAWNNILLWERSGDTPGGKLYEKCIFDYSEKGVLVHQVLERTLNGVPQEKSTDVILKKVSR